MNLSSESGNKKLVIAERMLDNGVPENLCNLFISHIDEFTVYSIYSALSKKFIGYRILQDKGASNEFNGTIFNSIFKVGMDPDFELVPKGFSNQGAKMNNSDFLVDSTLHQDELHVVYGLEKLASETSEPKVWVFNSGEVLSVIIAKDKRVHFANSFKYSDQTEFLYFIINAMKISQVQQDDTQLILDYSSARKFGLMEFLKPYFKQVSRMSIPFENPDAEMEELPFLLSINHIASLCV